MEMKQYIAAGASIFFASCNQYDSDEVAYETNWTPEEKRAWLDRREERLIRNDAWQKEQLEGVNSILQSNIEKIPHGGIVQYWSHQGIGDFMNRRVPKGLPGQDLKYYDKLVIKKKGSTDFGWELEAILDIASCDTGPSLYDRCFEASLWENGDKPEPPLHTWDLVQTRIQHTKELMKYLMELAGDVSDESEPSKFNYTIIVQNPQIQNPIAGGGSKSHELGRRVKRCEKYGLAHLPYVEGVLFKYWWYGFNKQRQM